MKIEIRPLKIIIDDWIETLVPKNDLFLWKGLFPVFKQKGYLVIPKEEFLKHPEYTKIEINNAYQYWLFDKTVSCIIVAEADWIFKLSKEEQQAIFKQQIDLNRGLISIIPNNIRLDHQYQNAIQDNRLVLTNKLFYSLPDTIKEEIVIKIAKSFDEWESYELDSIRKSHILEIANTFVKREGINCFSTTLYALTKDTFVFQQWVHPETFISRLYQLGYKQTDDDGFLEDDVLIIKDKQKITHAAYTLAKNIFLNKNGQMKFNPIKIVDLEYLKQEFAGEFICYRKIR